MHELEVPYSPEIKFNLVNKYHSEKNVSINKKKHGLTGPLHTILKHHELGEEKPDWYVVQCMSDLNNDCNHIQNERAVSQGVWFWLLNWDRCRSLVDMTEHEAVWIKCQVSLAGYITWLLLNASSLFLSALWFTGTSAPLARPAYFHLSSEALDKGTCLPGDCSNIGQ